jgi:hypothetical protein
MNDSKASGEGLLTVGLMTVTKLQKSFFFVQHHIITLMKLREQKGNSLYFEAI